MKVLIIEDEIAAANRLKKLVKAELKDAQIAAVLDSVEEAIDWLSSHPHPAIIFMDIQLADGLSFTIFEKVEIKSSVIFTTAFDHYAVNAFRVNGLDYLLKPIDPNELKAAIQKHYKTQENNIDYASLMKVLSHSTKKYKERLLIKLGNKLLHIPMEKVAYFFSEESISYARTIDGAMHLLDYTLENLQENIDPAYFFRINRKVILHIQALQRSKTYLNSRLKLEISPAPTFEVIVSREKVNAFKAWLDK